MPTEMELTLEQTQQGVSYEVLSKPVVSQCLADEEPVQKGKRVKRSAKKSSTTPATGIVIKETPIKTKSTGKEKVDVPRGKGIELLSEVALAEKAQLKEVRKKSLRDFHRTHPSGSGSVAEKPPSVEKIKHSVINDNKDKSDAASEHNDEENESNEDETQSDNKEGLDSENDTEENESDSEKEEDVKDDDEEEEEFIHTPSQSDDDEIEGDKDKGMDFVKEAGLNEPVHADKEVQEGIDAEMTEAQQGNENVEITQEQVIEVVKVTTIDALKETEVLATTSSQSSDLASKFLNFSDIPHTDAEIVSPFDVTVQHEVPNTQTTTLLPIPIFVITTIPQSLQTFTPPPLVSTPTPPPITEATNPLTILPDFASVVKFNERIIALEKEVAELKKDPLHTQLTTLVAEHLDTRLGETRDEFMKFLSESLTTRIKEQLIKESHDEGTLEKVSSQPHSTYEAASTLTKFKLKKILIDKMEKSESYLAAPKHRDCYDSQKKKDSTSGSSKGTKSQLKSFGKSIQSEEPVFEVADSDMPQDQEGNLGDNKDEPRNKTASRRDWFKKPTPPQEPTDPDWNISKTTQEGPTQNWLMTLAASTSTDKSLKDFDELMSTLIDFSGYILNGLKIENLTQEILLGPAFRLLKGTHSNYAELEYDFEECYKALSEKLDWENPEGGDYPFDLSKPLPLIKRGKHQRVPFEFFINNDLKYLQGGILTMTYTTSTTKTKAAKYDLPGIEDMVPNIWSYVKVAYDRYALWVTHVKVMRKHRYWYLEEIVVRRADNVLYRFKEGDDVADLAIALRMFTRSLVIQKRVQDLQLGIESYQKKINVTKPDTTRPDLRKRYPYTPYKDPQGFIYVDDYKRNRLMPSDELYKFSYGTLTRLLSSLEDITKNIEMGYLPKRRWSTLEKKRAHFMIKDINKLLKERGMMRSLAKFVGGIPKRPTMYLNLWSYKAVRHRYSNPTIQPEPEGSTQGYPLVSVEVLRFNTTAGNPVKKILLKLNLSDHRSILTDSKEYLKMVMEVPDFSCLTRFIATCSCPTDKYKDIMKAQITFSHSNQEKGTSSHQKSMITTSNHKLMIEVKDYELKTEVKA
ncbi:hypothetical protein Tco_1142762 [Tanacetum coccineum]